MHLIIDCQCNRFLPRKPSRKSGWICIQQTDVCPVIYYKLRNDIAKVPIEPGAGASGSAVDFDIVMMQFSYHQKEADSRIKKRRSNYFFAITLMTLKWSSAGNEFHKQGYETETGKKFSKIFIKILLCISKNLNWNIGRISGKRPLLPRYLVAVWNVSHIYMLLCIQYKVFTSFMAVWKF